MLAPGRWTLLLRMLFVLIIVLLAACSAPNPFPSAPLPTSAPTGTPIPIADPQLLPVLDRTIELGTRGQTSNWQLIHPIALDEQNRRLYVSTSVSKTVVLDAETLAQIGELDAGGSVAVLPERDRLYIGVPGTAYADGTPNVPAQLRVYQASTLAFHNRAAFSYTSAIVPFVSVPGPKWQADVSEIPPLAVPDPQTGQVYVVHQGVYIAAADSLEVTDFLSQTLPTPYPNGHVPAVFALSAALKPMQQQLFVSLFDGDYGSNSGTGLYVYDTSREQRIGYDFEFGVFLNLAFDPSAGTTFVSSDWASGATALIKFDAQGKVLRRLDSIGGKLQIDPLHDRVYLLNTRLSQISVLDRDLNYSGAINVDPMAGFIDFAIDAAHDRLFVLKSGGRLQVLRGHGQARRDQPPHLAPPRGKVEWIVPSPDFGHDRTVMAAFHTGGSFPSYSPLFVSRDDGQTWQVVTGLPMAHVRAAALAFSPDYAQDQTLWASFTNPSGSAGIYRSTDGGQTWQPASRGLTDLEITRLVVSPDFARDQTVFAAPFSPQTRGGLFRSNDGGLSWTLLAEGIWVRALAISPNFARDRRLLGLGKGTWLSRDGGDTWTKVLDESPWQVAYLAGGQTAYIMLDDGSVRRSDDGGEHWVAASDGLTMPLRGTVNLLAGDDFVLLAADAFERPTRLFYRPIKDQPWHEVDPTKQELGSVFALTRDGSLFTEDVTGKLHRYAVDNLKLTSSYHRPAGTLDAMVVVPTSAGNETIIRSISPEFATDNMLLVATFDGGLAISRDRGETWSIVD